MATTIGIDFVDVMRVIGDFKRPLVEGQAILDAKHVIMCGVSSINDKSADIEALCLQTSYLKGIPHRIQVRILAGEEKKILCSCTCKAGCSGKCKHIVATLLYIFRHTIENLEILSSTDVQQQWGKLKKEKDKLYKNVTPVGEFCHMNRRSSKTLLESRLGGTSNKNILKILLSGAEGSELKQSLCNTDELKTPFNSAQLNAEVLQLSLCHSIIGNNALITNFQYILGAEYLLGNDLSKFYSENIVVSYENSVKFCLATIHQAGSTWHDLRKVRITGTSCYNYFTYCKNKSPDWYVKVSKLSGNLFKGNRATFHGKKFECAALDIYEKTTGNKVEHLGIIIPTTAPYLGRFLVIPGDSWEINAAQLILLLARSLLLWFLAFCGLESCFSNGLRGKF